MSSFATHLTVQGGEQRRFAPGEYDSIVGNDRATIELESDYR